MSTTLPFDDEEQQRPTPSETRKRLRYLRQAWAAHVPIPLASLLGPRHRRAFGALTYHRVCPQRPGRSLPPLTVTPGRFRSQLAGLLARGYEPWSLSRALAAHRAGTDIPRRAFLVLFDDGFACVHQHAFPILRELQVPATIFVPTGWLDATIPFPFDEWRWAGDARFRDDWSPLSWDACREMLASGLVELGSHGHRHFDFRGNSLGFLRDLQTSVQQLRHEFGLETPTFSLPFGAWQADWRPLVQQAGVACCLTTDCQLIRPHDDPYAWGRFGAEEYDSPRSLAAKLDGWYSCLQNVWRAAKRGWPRAVVDPCRGGRQAELDADCPGTPSDNVLRP